ncbi:MAG: DNA polymerase IV [Eubacteriales bacterium]
MSKPCFMLIDVNSAFLSWEAVYRLQHGETVDLREIPSVVGGSEKSRHGIVLAKSLSAKKLYNIKTGEPLVQAQNKAGHKLVVVPPRHGLYKEASNAMINVLQQYSPVVERFSIDEAFLDYTGMERLYGDPVKTAHKIKDKIEKELGFTVNIGISSNKLLAKMACEFEKPNKVHTLWPHEIPQKMWPLPIGELYMVGRKTKEKLINKGIMTIGDLAKSDLSYVKKWIKGYGELIWHFANGNYEESEKGGTAFFQGMMTHSPDTKAKGIGNSSTIAFNLETKEMAYKALLSLSETVSNRLRNGSFKAKVIHVTYTTSQLQRFGKQKKYLSATNLTQEIYKRACEVFDELWDMQPIRAIGIHATCLSESEKTQTNMFEIENKKAEFIDSTLDSLRDRYGLSIIKRGCFLKEDISHMLGGSWGNPTNSQ